MEIGTQVVLNVGVGVGLCCVGVGVGVCVCVCAFFGLVGSCWCQDELLLLVHDGIMATDMQNHKAIVSSPALGPQLPLLFPLSSRTCLSAVGYMHGGCMHASITTSVCISIAQY